MCTSTQGSQPAGFLWNTCMLLHRYLLPHPLACPRLPGTIRKLKADITSCKCCFSFLQESSKALLLVFTAQINVAAVWLQSGALLHVPQLTEARTDSRDRQTDTLQIWPLASCLNSKPLLCFTGCWSLKCFITFLTQ